VDSIVLSNESHLLFPNIFVKFVVQIYIKMNAEILNKAKVWLSSEFDAETNKNVQFLIDNDPKELEDSFYRTLEFGTGGLRGVMGVGTNRMNIYTVSMATQGLANYLLKVYPNQQIKVAVGHDSRNNSPLFARTTAEVFAANGFTVYLFDSMRPTPELSFAIRHLGCKSGVVVTASHNPKEYNGYKAYWEDGAQVIPPHDTNIIDEVNLITSPSQVKKYSPQKGEIISIGEDVDEAYLKMIDSLSLSPDSVKRHNDFKIVYTPIHGTGIKLIPQALARYGFKNIILVESQCTEDGNFPTVDSPNPENVETMQMAMDLAEEKGADLVIGTDPDADREAIAIRNTEGKLVLLNGNQTGSLLVYYLLNRWNELGKLKGSEFVIKTIVTTGLISKIAEGFKTECYDVLTGFKWIADVIRRNEGKKQFIGGGEESFGFLVGDAVRDKDSIGTVCMVAEAAAWAADMGKSLWDILMEIYIKFGAYQEAMVSLTKKGQSGVAEIEQMMSDFRQNPPKKLAGADVIVACDYKSSEQIVNGVVTKLDLPKSNVLQWKTADGTIVSVRPSGTEPKIKFYFSVCEPLTSASEFSDVKGKLNAKVENLKNDLNL